MISNRSFHLFVTEGADRYSRVETPEQKRAILQELEATLQLLNGLDDGDVKEKLPGEKVVWALSPNNALWVAAGLNAEQSLIWSAFRQTPHVAGEWMKLGVSAGFASLMHTNGVNFPLYSLWKNFYGVNDQTSAEDHKKFLNEIVEFLSDPTVTPAQSKSWLAAGIPLCDISAWRKRGFTPTEAKKKIDSGVGVDDVGGEAVVTGTTYPKVVECANNNGWSVVSEEKHRDRYFVKLLRGDDTIVVRFSRTGQLSRFECSGAVAFFMNEGQSRHPYRLFFGRGLVLLKKALGFVAS